MPSYRTPQLERSYRFTPELIELLVETIPLLTRSKDALLTFFRGSGVPEPLLYRFRELIRSDRRAISKYQIVRSVLSGLEARGDATLHARREVIRRVATFDDFSLCWDHDQTKASILVERTRFIVQLKDASTRTELDRDSRRRETIARAERDNKARFEWRRNMLARVSRLCALDVTRRRPSDVSQLFQELFVGFGIRPKRNFGESIPVDVDTSGLIEFDRNSYLVDVLWREHPISSHNIGPHLVRVFNGNGVRGLFISGAGYTNSAAEAWQLALQEHCVVLLTIEDITLLLESHGELQDLLRDGIEEAQSVPLKQNARAQG